MTNLSFHSVINDYNYFFWKDIKDFENEYAVSILGVLSKSRLIKHRNGTQYYTKARYLKAIKGNVGYIVFSLWNNNIGKPYLFHRILCFGFKIQSDSAKRFIDHLDGNKLNNALSNLEWVTQTENNRRAYKTGLRNGDHKRLCRRGIHPSAKKVAQLNKMGSIIKIFDCKIDAEEAVDVCVGYFIKNRKMCPKGYFWKYV